MKRILAMVLAAALAVSVFAGCNKDTGTSTSTSTGTSTSTSAGDAGDADTSDPSNPWADIMDYSEEVNINLIAFGTEPLDAEKVITEINKEMKDFINTTIDVTFVSLGEWSTKYPLLLTGGDDIDLTYAAIWTTYNENVEKGAYMEITPDFMAKYMPVTDKVQPKDSYELMMRNGKIYTVPRNQAEDQSYGAWLIRSDIATEYGYKKEDFKTIEDLKAFLLDIGKKGIGEKTGVFPWYLFPSLPVENQILVPYLNWFPAGNLYWKADTETTSANCFYMYTAPEYKEYVLQQAEFAANGVWPSNAITGQTHTIDLFHEGKSVVNAGHYKDAADAFKHFEVNGLECWYINLMEDYHYTRPQTYREGIAIAASSKNPERAAVVLDILKNYDPIHYLAVGGIEGEHYIIQDDGTRIVGPAADNFPWDGWSWGFRNDTDPKLDTYDEVEKVRDELIAAKLDVQPFEAFSFNQAPVNAEYTIITALVNEYNYSWDLGVFGAETEARFDAFIAELEAAGLEKCIAEARSQIDAFMAAKGM